MESNTTLLSSLVVIPLLPLVKAGPVHQIDTLLFFADHYCRDASHAAGAIAPAKSDILEPTKFGDEGLCVH